MNHKEENHNMVSKKAREDFLKNFPATKIISFIRDLVFEITHNSQLQGRKQTMAFFREKWNAFLFREFRPFYNQTLLETYHIKQKHITTKKEITKSSSLEDPLGFLPKLREDLKEK